tara:strand:- start:135 stop:647 length:513 start_codon:yes stop_codon:yes gene_type:complete
MAKSSAEKGREVPNQSEQRETKKSFKGNERTIGWSLKQVETGQFIQFTYKSKQRRVLVLTPDWRNVKENSILTCVDLTMLAFAPNKLNRIFDIGAFPRLIRTAVTDKEGFRFFQISPDIIDVEKLVSKNKFFKNNYKTFFRKRLTGVIKMWNPIFSPAMIKKLNIEDVVL